MSEELSPLAGKPLPASALVDVDALLAAYASERPDPTQPTQRIAFGTSGHRGSSLARSFNEWHVLAVTQAICDHRELHGVDGPLFIGCDSHALSLPAFESALEVLAANGVPTRISAGGEFTPTPALSLAIVDHNRGRDHGLADGIVITPSHNPPEHGGLKYNPSHGGPADTATTRWIEERANDCLAAGLQGVRRLPLAQARRSDNVAEYDFLGAYVAALGEVVDFAVIRGAGVRLGVDPLGGAGVHYWAAIADRYGIGLEVVDDAVDPRFGFMTADWDGRIRMDPSSRHAMQRLLGLKDRFDVAFACDTDHDRHGIVTRSAGLMPSNHFLSVLVHELFTQRPDWPVTAAVGKTAVTTALIDRIATALDRPLYEVPVGFKWFAPGLADASLGFGCEESAGASFLRRDGRSWTTDKDGIAPSLLAAEMTARHGRDPGELYAALAGRFGAPASARVDATATPEQKRRLAALTPQAVRIDSLAGEPVHSLTSTAAGNGQPIGGIKAIADSGWFAARPSGTEDIYKIYAESFKGEEHLRRLLDEARAVVDRALSQPSAEEPS
ncbi:MAG TPA: alpha-D-glucose phosphate-specific phosphoglucomutase [Rhodanobacteraceae bacterium]|nr:alpha-D-glucose phosphate-specific phosphoglucomutase [Rhodanobacteraceae bacterium]